MNYRSLNLIALAVLAGLVPAVTFGVVGAWVFLPLALSYVIVLGWGVFDIGSQFFGRTYWKAKGQNVSITFDDGPHPTHTQQILRVLREEHVHAGFFCIGKHAEAHPELVEQMMKEGHLVGNHTYHHTHRFGMFNQAQVSDEIIKGRNSLARIIGKQPRFFRPPFGVMNPKIMKAVEAEDDVVIGWDLRSRDGVARSEQQILDRVMPRLKTASLLLFHDTNPHTPEALRKVIRALRESGRNIVRVDRLVGQEPYRN
jgi:peptidoglycan/xylan/chitin deacetylase (PgdA/CDA1 family)